ncbi:hypothetical protein CYMTET_29374 [Cymbomonas tetramitiformis]|uniref:Uncharacterized protein n=1 Tax=Cymbomonas tetramitiformis TaxID=36881 RepID=A0AAE0FKY5_9CHLO|nr:hypothetical protein CYMTET_29374 [Cymbomonas tetramitiformis]
MYVKGSESSRTSGCSCRWQTAAKAASSSLSNAVLNAETTSSMHAGSLIAQAAITFSTQSRAPSGVVVVPRAQGTLLDERRRQSREGNTVGRSLVVRLRPIPLISGQWRSRKSNGDPHPQNVDCAHETFRLACGSAGVGTPPHLQDVCEDLLERHLSQLGVEPQRGNDLTVEFRLEGRQQLLASRSWRQHQKRQ